MKDTDGQKVRKIETESFLYSQNLLVCHCIDIVRRNRIFINFMQ